MTAISKIFNNFETQFSDSEIQVKDFVAHMRQHSIILFGAGSAGIGFLIALRKLGIFPLAFLDNSIEKRGSNLEGLTVYSPSEYARFLPTNALVIICLNTDGKRMNANWKDTLRIEPNAIISDLNSKGYSNVVYYTDFWRCYGLFRHENFPLPSCADVVAILENRGRIEDAYELFDEKFSKDIFESYLSYRLISRETEIPTSSFEKKYFFHSFLTLTENEIFVDGGAFNGNTLDRFLIATGQKFSEYHGFEPDARIFANIKERCAHYPESIRSKIFLSANALYDSSCDLPFYELNGPGSLVHEIGGRNVKGIALDSVPFNDLPTYIKFNIEGCEKNAVEGCSQLIKANAPTFSIRLLKISDLWSISFMLKTLNPGYRFFLRTYMGQLDFFLYAVDKKRVKG